MLTIGITGGIGSGKSTVCKVVETLAVPVFYADNEAKQLYFTDDEVAIAVKKLFGHAVDEHGRVMMNALAAEVFRNKEKLAALNQIVHPAVKRAFEKWKDQQKGKPYVIHEAAIMIETGSYKDCDHLILVSAPMELRIERAMKLYKLSREEVVARINRQWSDEEKRKHCDIELVNDGSELLLPQIIALHENFSRGV